jgi:PAS domain S-box-containing protein
VQHQELHSVSEWWRIFVESVADYAFILFDTDCRVAAWNIGAERVLGYTSQEIMGQSGAVFFVSEDRERGEFERELAIALRDGRADDERWHVRQDGSRFLASGTLTVLRGPQNEVIGFAKVMRDVTAREEARLNTEQALRERMVMLKEVHHRVKNNLQLIVSLMRLQADHVHDPDLLSLFQKARTRVRAIAAVHERLYSTDDFTTIHIGRYLEDLARELHRFYQVSDSIRFTIETADLALGMNQAIALALIANELLSNAFEHAFPGDRSGNVSVILRYEQSDSVERGELKIADDGVGLPDHVTLEESDTMGFDLVRLLSSQIHAEITMPPRRNGACFRISFPVGDEES